MDDWWSDTDEQVVRSLEAHGPMSPADLGSALGISERAAASLVAMLAAEGKVGIRLVGLPSA